MSRLKAQPMIRTFSYNGLTLPDIDVNRTPEQIRDLYSATYPEIATAVIEGPEAVDGVLRYKLTRAVGTKG